MRAARQFTRCLLHACAPVLLSAQQVNGCPSADADESALFLRHFARHSVAATTPESIEWRASVGLTAQDSSKVAIVNDTRACASAVAAINTYFGTPGAVRTVQVAKLVNSGFMVFQPLPAPAPGGSARAVFFMSKRFVIREVLIGT
jgi:hypothetical protein